MSLRYKEVTLLLLLLSISISAVPVARISFLPDTLMEIGEPLYLSADRSTNISNMQRATYEWDFGDGCALKIGFPTSSSAHTGICCTHIFMKPGRFRVMLRVTDADRTKDSAFVYVTVSGETPLQGFELWRAPFHARIAQYIYAQIPASVTGNSQNTLRVTVRRSADSSIVTSLLDKTGLQKEERFLLKNAELPSGNYYLLAELLNPSRERISYIKERIDKPYDGAPRVGIDENNSMWVNGKPFFPVTPWLLSTEEFPAWAGKYANGSYGVGWYPSHTVATWTDYLTAAERYNLFILGPERWDGKGAIDYEKNSSPAKIVEYVNATKNKPMMGMWMWKDEPNLGGRAAEVSAEVMDAWSYLCHVNDPHHPVTCNMYGFDYLSYYDPPRTYVDYLWSDQYFGGKKHFCFDVSGFDIYPIHFGTHASLNQRRVMAEYIAAFDRMLANNYSLIPAMSFIEVQDIGDRPTPAPTLGQILMEAWLTVIHGAKGINWFQYFGDTPRESFEAMGIFYRQMVRFGAVILGPPPQKTVTTNATAPSNRVDCMRRDHVVGSDTSIYLFTARLTEPDSSACYANWREPDSIPAIFTVEGLSGRTVNVEGENRTISSTGNTFRDTFRKNAVHIYRIGKDLLPVQKIKPGRTGSIGGDNGMRVSCAPFQGSVVLPLSAENRQIGLFNLQGRLVNQVPVRHAKLQWGDVPAAGTYLYRVTEKSQDRGFIMLYY
ncbi:MAG: PKD domain-containing protein [Chitinispirillaceae bacterium]|nr:PKD domain-containing protein [Chitinispirillaceae bacterium]